MVEGSTPTQPGLRSCWTLPSPRMKPASTAPQSTRATARSSVCCHRSAVRPASSPATRSSAVSSPPSPGGAQRPTWMVPWRAQASSHREQSAQPTQQRSALSTDPAERSKAEPARTILRGRDLGLSVQVLQEVYVQATRASRPDPLEPELVVRFLEALCRFPVQDLTTSVVRSSFATSQRWRISYWDAAIIEAARALGCSHVWSEDLADGATTTE